MKSPVRHDLTQKKLSFFQGKITVYFLPAETFEKIEAILVLHRFVEDRLTSVSAIEGGGNEQVAKPVVMVTKAIEIRFARLSAYKG